MIIDDISSSKLEMLPEETNNVETEPSYIPVEIQLHKGKVSLGINALDGFKVIKFPPKQSELIMCLYHVVRVGKFNTPTTREHILDVLNIEKESLSVYVSQLNLKFNKFFGVSNEFKNLIVPANGIGYMFNPNYLVYFSDEH